MLKVILQYSKMFSVLFQKFQGLKENTRVSRRLFKSPEVTPAGDLDLKWEKPDEEALVKFMCEEKGFQVFFEGRFMSLCSKPAIILGRVR